MFSLDNREKQLLLGIARRSMTSAVARLESESEGPERELGIKQCAGAFVTLKRSGRLRGCIGQIVLGIAMAEVVSYSAAAAALQDPRFQPVRIDELAEIEIEISILSTPEEIQAHEIEAGKHGLIVSRGSQRGLLLPQVAAEHRWESQRFLEETCVKAGLEREAWKDPLTKISGFTAIVFSESEIPAVFEPESRQ
jgi:AmmeMemoRadiSam system protein A